MKCRTFTNGVVLAATILAAAPLSVFAQERADGPIQAWHPVLAASIERVAAESPSFREALRAVTATGRRAVVDYTGQGKRHVRLRQRSRRRTRSVDEQSRLNTVLVVINLELLQRLSGSAG